MRLGISFVAAMALLVSLEAFADELKLKDGTKIVGTIVGFEDNSFKVKTSFGFAEVQKDQVLSINITESAKSDAKEKKPEPTSEKTFTPANSINSGSASASASLAPAESANKTAISVPSPTAPPTAKNSPAPVGPPTTPASSAPALPAAKSLRPSPPAAPPKLAALTPPSSVTEHAAPSFVTAPPTATITATPTPAAPLPARADAKGVAAPASAPLPPAVSAPPKPAAAEPVREEVSGNLYTNDTYGFRMYKPPDWQVIAGVRTVLPGSIAALGTNDQTTYLLIGEETPGKSLSSEIDATELRLREALDNFRPLGEQRIKVSGNPAIERRFRGSAGARDWSGVVVFIPRGTRLYTIFGMTAADSDLVQIQENVIIRAISSLQFINP
jgi:hypothetical protein